MPNLPGDIHYRGKNTDFHFPVIMCIVLSIVLTIGTATGSSIRGEVKRQKAPM